jgi:hypothetical protein
MGEALHNRGWGPCDRHPVWAMPFFAAPFHPGAWAVGRFPHPGHPRRTVRLRCAHVSVGDTTCRCTRTHARTRAHTHTHKRTHVCTRLHAPRALDTVGAPKPRRAPSIRYLLLFHKDKLERKSAGGNNSAQSEALAPARPATKRSRFLHVRRAVSAGLTPSTSIAGRRSTIALSSIVSRHHGTNSRISGTSLSRFQNLL